MPICYFCREKYQREKDHLYDGLFLHKCNYCLETTLIKVRFHLSSVLLDGHGKIYRLEKKYRVLRTSIVRCWKCFKALTREQSQKMLIEKYSIHGGMEGCSDVKKTLVEIESLGIKRKIL
jgi:hypothetical protein